MSNNKIFIGNLAFSLEEADLREAFEKFGAIIEVAIPTERNPSGGAPRKRGFGFITFETDESATNALSMNGVELNDRPIRVDMGTKKEGSGRR